MQTGLTVGTVRPKVAKASNNAAKEEISKYVMLWNDVSKSGAKWQSSQGADGGEYAAQRDEQPAYVSHCVNHAGTIAHLKPRELKPTVKYNRRSAWYWPKVPSGEVLHQLAKEPDAWHWNLAAPQRAIIQWIPMGDNPWQTGYDAKGRDADDLDFRCLSWGGRGLEVATVSAWFVRRSMVTRLDRLRYGSPVPQLHLSLFSPELHDWYSSACRSNRPIGHAHWIYSTREGQTA